MSFNSYIAGLDLPFTITDAQAINGLAWVSLVGSLYCVWPRSIYRQRAEREAGKVVHMPPGKRGGLITGIHGAAAFVPAVAFLTSLPVNKFIIPSWLLRTSFPGTSPEVYYGVRVAGCVGFLGVGVAMISIYKHLGAQFHYVGVRERPKLIKTGPYSVARHPMYSCAMSSGICLAAAFWNWMPLAALGIMSTAFAIKMPMEEQVILNNKEIGDAYKEYKKEVPWRVLPYIW
ncbi:hypothetical protein BDV93DRAFT_520361 [Ceratobasidium sp. AG-I]|nr:hypothetical protein BDV93DRAFT_520361 [Ceratobasidium sp. AG-I]